MDWQIIIAVLTGLALAGGIIWRFAAIEIRTKGLPETIADIRDRLARAEAQVNDVFDLLLEEGRSRRRDLREHRSEPKLTKAARDLIPDDVKKSITRKRMESNNCLPARVILRQLKQELTIERLSLDATGIGLDLLAYLALLVDYEEEPWPGR